ncbi:MAG: hypothetical protein NPIRA01_08620 [Nitrospirales bacterium]|nr:MAG: hypothetical protein NPIRA01_08620 [Nitrospirales bacterium]
MMSRDFKLSRDVEVLPGNGFAQKKLQRVYQEWKKQGSRLRNTLRAEEVDLSRALVPGEAGFDAETWADLTGNIRRASMLLADSPHVNFLEQYREMGQFLFLQKHFVQTTYFKNAEDCVRIVGSYFSQKTIDGLLAQAKSFVTLYERIKKGDLLEVKYPSEEGHSERGSLPAVRKTWTTNTVQIDDGLHRLAVKWVLTQKTAKAIVLCPPMPTAVQSLVGKVSRSWGERELFELHQPIGGVEFDDSWPIVRQCYDRLSMMLTFLETYQQASHEWSVLDLLCSYGWFVDQFAKIGCQAFGVDPNPAALKIGQLAYGLQSEQLVKGDVQTFLNSCERTYDVVLLLSILQDFLPKSDFGSAIDILKKVDRITEQVLFFETGQAHERWFRDSLREWNNDFIVSFIKRHTSFTHVIPLGTDSDNVGGFSQNFGRTLFACVRSPGIWTSNLQDL